MSMNFAENMRRAFNLERISEAYVSMGHLTELEFDQILHDVLRIRALHLPDLDWLLLDQLLGLKVRIPLEAHFQALSAGLDQPFKDIETFYRQAIDKHLLPPRTLNRTSFYRVPTHTLRTGELAVEVGVVSMRALQMGLGLQVTIQGAIHSQVMLGQVLRSVGDMSVIDLFQILGLQAGIPFVSLNQSAPAIAAAVHAARNL